MLLSMVSCSENDINLNKEFHVSLNENIQIENKGDLLNLEFEKVLEYSLCPENTNCVWAGRVRIQIKLNASDVFILGILDDENPSTITYEKYEISLLKVTPIIQETNTRYNATFMVTEIEL